MKKFLFIVSVLLVAFSSCVRQGLETSVLQPESDGRLYFKVEKDLSFDVSTKSTNNGFHVVEGCGVVKGYMTGSMSSVSTKGWLKEESDYDEFVCEIWTRSSSGGTWYLRATDTIVKTGSYYVTQNDDYYFNNCDICVWVYSSYAGSVRKTNNIFYFDVAQLSGYEDNYYHQIADEDEVYGYSLINNFDCSINNVISVTLNHTCCAFNFVVSSCRSDISITNITLNNVISKGYFNTSGDFTATNGYRINVSCTDSNGLYIYSSDNDTDILDSMKDNGSFIFAYPGLGSGSYRLNFSLSYEYDGTEYTITKYISDLGISSLSSGTYYTISMDFDSLTGDSSAPYIYFGDDPSENQTFFVDSNGDSSYQVPFCTNIPSDVTGNWSLSSENSYWDVNVYGNYSYLSRNIGSYNSTITGRWISSSTFKTLNFDGNTNTPLDDVDSSNGFRVYQYPSHLYLSPTSYSVYVGDEIDFTAIFDRNGSFESDITNVTDWDYDPDFLEDQGNGTFLCIAASSGTDVDVDYDGKSALTSATVVIGNVTQQTHNLEISPSSSSIVIGGTASFTATYWTYNEKLVYYGNGSFGYKVVSSSSVDVTDVCTWSFYDRDYGVVLNDGDGVFTGIDTGSQYIYASYDGIDSGNALISVSANISYRYWLVIEYPDSYFWNIGDNYYEGLFVGNSMNVEVYVYTGTMSKVYDPDDPDADSDGFCLVQTSTSSTKLSKSYLNGHVSIVDDSVAEAVSIAVSGNVFVRGLHSGNTDIQVSGVEYPSGSGNSLSASRELKVVRRTGSNN